MVVLIEKTCLSPLLPVHCSFLVVQKLYYEVVHVHVHLVVVGIHVNDAWSCLRKGPSSVVLHCFE